MNLRFFRYIFILTVTVIFTSCRQAKYVPEGYYLLNKNKVQYADKDGSEWENDHELLDEDEIDELVRPETNSGFRLWVYNRIDTTRFQKQVVRKTKKHQKKQNKRDAKVDRKNQKRIDKARSKGKTHYKKKEKKPKTKRLGWRNWVRTHWGQPPVLMDTSKITKTKQQMEIYLSQRGFKHGTVTDTIIYKEKKRKAEVVYSIDPGEPYRINSISFDPAARNSNLIKQYQKMVKKEGTALEVGDLLDEDKLDDERDHYTKFLKDNAFFGFTKNYINFVVDTTIGDYKADVVIFIKEKKVQTVDENGIDTLVAIPHYVYTVDKVTYKLHNPDSASFRDWEGYKKRCKELGISYPYKIDGHYALLDTMLVIDTVITTYRLNLNSDRRRKHNIGLFEKFVDTLISHKGYFIYNEEPFLKPEILDKQNFLEHSDPSRGEFHYAKDYYIDRSFKSLLQLDVFGRITPTLEVSPTNPFGTTTDITYDLTPSPKQQFTVEPRATNTASILGISGKLTYKNKNLYRAANRLIVTVEGGMQSQPLVAPEGKGGSKVFRFRGLNTFEIGPEVAYEMPKFYPMTKKMQANLSKRAFPSTKISALYNFQRRPEFFRHVAELSYKWQFSSPDQTQRFTVTPIRLDYIFLNKQPSFTATLLATNDPFLINAYSDFFSLGILNVKHEYNNQKLAKNKRRFIRDHAVSNTLELTAAGLVMNTIDALTIPNTSFVDAWNQQGKLLFQVPFAQYVKLENTFIFNQDISRKHRMAYRFNVGVGLPYGNGIALPYTQSFVAGGSNDIRAFDARTMAPGGTQTWNQQNSTETQIGDMKVMANIEWRFNVIGKWNGALFVDAGNIWKIKSDDPNDEGVFDFGNFYKQIAIGTGFGVRYDLTFLVVRLDMSWTLHNPYLPAGSRWWLRDNGGIATYDQSFKVDASNKKVDYLPPHHLNFNIGIGYPF